MPLQLRKGTEAERTSGNFVPAVGEPVYTVDTKRIFVGDGLTPGGNSILSGINLSDVGDVTLNSENFATITQVQVTSNTVLVTTATSHPFNAGDIVSVTLTTNTALNGAYAIGLTALPNQFTFTKTTADLASVSDLGRAQEITTDGSVLTWNAEQNAWVNLPPVTSISALEDVALTNLSDGEILVYNNTLSKWENGPVATTLEALSDVNIASPADNQVLVYDSTTSAWQNETLSFSGLGSRSTASATTASIADNVSANIQITGFKSYMLMSVSVTAGCIVTLYTSSAARTADSSRLYYIDPLPGSGVVAEIIFSSAATQVITPSLLGFNDDATPSNNIYARVTNRSGASAAITVTLKLLRLEA